MIRGQAAFGLVLGFAASGCVLASQITLGGTPSAVLASPSSRVAESPQGKPIPGSRQSGRVLDSEGLPVSNASVRVFPIPEFHEGVPFTNAIPFTNAQPASRQGDAAFHEGTPLNSQGAAALRSLQGTLQAAEAPPDLRPVEVKTDTSGVFILPEGLSGLFNLVASAKDLKAWKGKIRVNRDEVLDIGPLRLAPPGEISGRVVVTSPFVTDTSGVLVFIPGSDYVAVTAADGGFTLRGVPEGDFDILADHRNFGQAKGSAKVQTGKTSQLADLVMSTKPPAITELLQAGTDTVIDNAATGSEIDLRGENFGVDRGERILVQFAGAGDVEAKPISGNLLRVRVPRAATTGEVSVKVGGLPSATVDFVVLASATFRVASRIEMRAGGCFDLGSAFEVKDTSGTRTPAHPNFFWEVEGSGNRVKADFKLEATSAGAFLLTAIVGEVRATSSVVVVPSAAPLDAQYCDRMPRVELLAGGVPASYLDGTGSVARFNNPFGLARGEDGTLYIADRANNRIRKVTPDGAVSTLTGSTFGYEDGNLGAAKFNSPNGIAIDAKGTLYIADTDNHAIRKITPTGVVSTVAGKFSAAALTDGIGSAARFNNPYGVALDQAGQLYVADYGNHAIRKIVFDENGTATVTTLAGNKVAGFRDGQGKDAQFNQPTALVVDPNGDVYVADRRNNRIRKIGSDGSVLTIAGSGIPASSDATVPLKAEFSSPNGITRDTAGNLFVTDTGSGKIRKIHPSGEVSTLAGSGELGHLTGWAPFAKFYRPAGIVIDNKGFIYVLDQREARVLVIRP